MSSKLKAVLVLTLAACGSDTHETPEGLTVVAEDGLAVDWAVFDAAWSTSLDVAEDGTGWAIRHWLADDHPFEIHLHDRAVTCGDPGLFAGCAGRPDTKFLGIEVWADGYIAVDWASPCKQPELLTHELGHWLARRFDGDYNMDHRHTDKRLFGPGSIEESALLSVGEVLGCEAPDSGSAK